VRPSASLSVVPSAPVASHGSVCRTPSRPLPPGIGHAEEITVGIVPESGEAVQGIVDSPSNKSILIPLKNPLFMKIHENLGHQK